MAILGIDPGQKGGFAILLSEASEIISKPIEIIPYFGNDLQNLREICTAYSVRHAVIEKAQAMPGQGVSSMFNYGVSFGKIIGFVESEMVPYTLVTPAKWTKEMLQGVPTKFTGKQRAAYAAERLFPEADFKASARCKKPHEGAVDAVLIAEWGRRNLKL